MLRVTEFAAINTNARNSLVVCHLNWLKSSRQWHRGLIHKFIRFGIPQIFFVSFILFRSLRAKIGKTLYTLYMSLPLNQLSQLYDTTILAKFSSTKFMIELMQDYRRHFKPILKNWLFTINFEKRSALLLTRKWLRHVRPSLTLFIEKSHERLG